MTVRSITMGDRVVITDNISSYEACFRDGEWRVVIYTNGEKLSGVITGLGNQLAFRSFCRDRGDYSTMSGIREPSMSPSDYAVAAIVMAIAVAILLGGLVLIAWIARLLS